MKVPGRIKEVGSLLILILAAIKRAQRERFKLTWI